MRISFFKCFLIAYFVRISSAVVCYDCRSDDSTCNVGQCHGMSCLKMETSNMDNERKTVHKSCIDELEPTRCDQSGFGSKLITRCSCNEDFCNADEFLSETGLQTSTATSLTHTFIIYFSLLLTKII